MKKTPAKKAASPNHGRLSIFEVAWQAHHTVARHCDYCGRPMTPSDANDYGTLYERCYMKEYYNQ